MGQIKVSLSSSWLLSQGSYIKKEIIDGKIWQRVDCLFVQWYEKYLKQVLWFSMFHKNDITLLFSYYVVQKFGNHWKRVHLMSLPIHFNWIKYVTTRFDCVTFPLHFSVTQLARYMQCIWIMIGLFLHHSMHFFLSLHWLRAHHETCKQPISYRDSSFLTVHSELMIVIVNLY